MLVKIIYNPCDIPDRNVYVYNKSVHKNVHSRTSQNILKPGTMQMPIYNERVKKL
jgi:hypothetical protein